MLSWVVDALDGLNNEANVRAGQRMCDRKRQKRDDLPHRVTKINQQSYKSI